MGKDIQNFQVPHMHILLSSLLSAAERKDIFRKPVEHNPVRQRMIFPEFLVTSEMKSSVNHELKSPEKLTAEDILSYDNISPTILVNFLR